MTTISGTLSGWFRRRGKDDKPADDQSSPNEAASGSKAVTGGEGETEPVAVWDAPNRMEAEIVKAHLESEGIPAIITGDVAASIFGFHTGELAKATVLVPAPLAERAFEILEAALEAADPDIESDSLDPDSSEDESIQSKGQEP
jgi:hypothetical protein